MKAVRLHAFGGPEVLRYEDAPRPRPGPGEVIVRVHAVGVNPPDWNLREGYRSLPPEWRPNPSFPLILGSDISGVVDEVGEDVTGFGVGDAVYALVRFPRDVMEGGKAYAQYVSVPVGDLAPKPAGIDHVHAAGAPMSLLTAWQFLIDLGHDEPNPFQPFRHEPAPLEGKTVVVNGAGGGVGHLAVQLARWQGARVVAVASGRNEALMRAFGVDRFVDYTQEAVEDVVRDADVVLDAVGGEQASRFLPILKPGGALFLVYPIGFSAHAAAEARDVTVSSTQVRSNGAQLAQAGRLLDDGTIRVVVDSVFPLAQAAKAHERAAAGGLQGKIVLTAA
ncbi:NADP-dependent oxidoreductase [Caulobacter hibisci]|uniref:NADP-dependent oxidoreductase n=1 Tax=Caulobacter hibisci TaxID=2035993 RepID=A0ABS0T4G3_9CAUL|nr:NADP-dependent oxidoreductase [Caulobacter hibisci]MBI1686764.1 NADP-dependent oxidoreductase [Caulobacter hibisci]